VLIVIVLTLLGGPAPSSATVPAHTLATLTELQARHLAGKRARYCVELDRPETELDGFHCFGCRSVNDDERGVRFCPSKAVGEHEVDVLVEAELRVRRFGAWQGVPAFTQFELVDAVRVRPR
jgi:hypothetical protein